MPSVDSSLLPLVEAIKQAIKPPEENDPYDFISEVILS
jgi:hypothetical protein